MLYNNKFIYDFIRFILNKEQTSNIFSPKDFNTIVPACSLKHFKEKIGNPDEYRVGIPKAAQQDGLTESIDNSLLPFTVNTTLSVNSSGIAQKPQDFYKRLSLSFWHIQNTGKTNDKRLRVINVVNDDTYTYQLSSSVAKPTIKNPIANFQNDIIRFYPIKNTVVDFVYRKLPINCYYDYYINAYGGHTYLEPNTTHTLLTGEEGSEGQTAGQTVTSKSVELEWQPVDILDICSKVLALQGVNLRDGMILQYAEQAKQSGV